MNSNLDLPLPRPKTSSTVQLLQQGRKETVESTGSHVGTEEHSISAQELVTLVVATDQVGTPGDETGLEHAHEEAAGDQSRSSFGKTLSEDEETFLPVRSYSIV
jgi:hypothetical protein